MCGLCQCLWVSPGSPAQTAMKHFLTSSLTPTRHCSKQLGCLHGCTLSACTALPSPQKGEEKDSEKAGSHARKESPYWNHPAQMLTDQAGSQKHPGDTTGLVDRFNVKSPLYPSEMSFLLRTLFCIAVSFPFQGFCICPFPNLLFPLTFQNIIRIRVPWQLLFSILTTESSCKPSPKLITFDIITVLGNVSASCGNFIFFIKKKSSATVLCSGGLSPHQSFSVGQWRYTKGDIIHQKSPA